MHVVIDKKCIGCKVCVDICPDVFALRGNGIVESIINPVPLDAIECWLRAEDECPVSAIMIME
jgi:ferredoxin